MSQFIHFYVVLEFKLKKYAKPLHKNNLFQTYWLLW